MNSASIGIIGGADGPTAIFVTTSEPVWLTLLYCAAIIAAAVLLIRWAIRRFKNK